MTSMPYLVVTSINAKNEALESLAAGANSNQWGFVLVGDRKTPEHDDPRYTYLDLEAQRATGFRFARSCPENHYARKNVGYLWAMRAGAEVIVETDDDNFPLPSFFSERSLQQDATIVRDGGWVNFYRYFTASHIWPRGFPLESLQSQPPEVAGMAPTNCESPIQQGLADDNPDVDSIYRLVLPLPQHFQDRDPVAIGPGTYCPFNSQNTTWFPSAYPLLYLPAHCSFRMTDIWRSFVAQRVAAENEWPILFTSPTVRQERNEHDLMKDFRDEVPGFLRNGEIVERLYRLSLGRGSDAVVSNLMVCYEELVACGAIAAAELPLLESWLADLEAAQ